MFEDKIFIKFFLVILTLWLPFYASHRFFNNRKSIKERIKVRTEIEGSYFLKRITRNVKYDVLA